MMQSSSSSPRVLIIGAGPSGLVAVKEMRAAGLDAIAVDKRQEIGGVFAASSGVTYEDLHLTTSNFFMAFSDFPPKDKCVKYWNQKEYYEYLQDYAEAFDLYNHIRLGVSVQQAELCLETKKWNVAMESADKRVESQEFDFLIIATGANIKPRIPSVFHDFTGEVIHSADFRSGEQVRGKRVLVAGTGESAADVAYAAAQTGKSCTVWNRRFPDLAPRFISKWCSQDGYDEVQVLKHQDNLQPGEFLESMSTSRINRNLPLAVWSASLHGLLYSMGAKYGPNSVQGILEDLVVKSYASDPWSSDTSLTPTKSSIMGCVAAQGGLDMAIAPSITCKDKTVTFHDMEYYKTDFVKEPHTHMDLEFDIIVACTGYQAIDHICSGKWLKTPVPINPNPRTWFKHCFPPQLGPHMAFLGYARPHSGGIPQCSEILARYVAQLCMGAKDLPDNYEEIAIVEGKCESECYHQSPNNPLLMDYHAFMISVARLIGCTPRMPWNPLELVKFWTSPLWPCFFRTQGPGAKPETCRAVTDRFGPYSALAPAPLLILQLIFTFVMPLVNVLSYFFGFLVDIRKQTALPRLYRWRVSKFHFMYANLYSMGAEDWKMLVGQIVAGILVLQHIIRSTLSSSSSTLLNPNGTRHCKSKVMWKYKFCNGMKDADQKSFRLRTSSLEFPSKVVIVWIHI